MTRNLITYERAIPSLLVDSRCRPFVQLILRSTTLVNTITDVTNISGTQTRKDMIMGKVDTSNLMMIIT